MYHKDNAHTVNLATLLRVNVSRFQRELVGKAFEFKYATDLQKTSQHCKSVRVARPIS